jgi:phage terminase large subunit-like protein
VVHDELGQVKGPRSELYEAIETATAAQEDPLSIIISTQAPTDNDLLSILIDDAIKSKNKKVKLFLYSASNDSDPFSVKAIKKANPAYEYFQNKDEILNAANSAKRMPTSEAAYRNLILNQRVNASNPFITKTVWEENGGDVIEDWEGCEVFAGLDLSSTTDLTAFVMVTRVDGLVYVKPIFWLPQELISERTRQDRRPYDIWYRNGFLEVTPGKCIEYEFVAAYIAKAIKDFNISKVRFDSWSMSYFRPWLVKAGMSEQDIAEKFEEFRQGFKSMSPAVRNLETLLLNNRIRHGMHPVLTMCASQSVVTMDAAGNKKLDKEKSYGRIDGMVALAMAVSNIEQIEKPTFITDKLLVMR